jgi:hypothetical protein
MTQSSQTVNFKDFFQFKKFHGKFPRFFANKARGGRAPLAPPGFNDIRQARNSLQRITGYKNLMIVIVVVCCKILIQPCRGIRTYRSSGCVITNAIQIDNLHHSNLLSINA